MPKSTGGTGGFVPMHHANKLLHMFPTLTPQDFFIRPGGTGADSVLSAWMEAKGIDDETLARTIGMARSTISRVRRGLQGASEELAARIEQASQGAVGRQSLVRAAKPSPTLRRQKERAA